MNRVYWRVKSPAQRCAHTFNTRQKAVEYANSYYDKHGILAEITKCVKAPRTTPKADDGIALCSKKCMTCRYSFNDCSKTNLATTYCGYILHTGKPRPCPAGVGCTEYKRRPNQGKKGKE